MEYRHWADRHQGQSAVPGRDDVRRVRQPRSRRLVRIIHHALDAGINFIDTADMYSAGESETIVGKALAAAAATTSSSPRRSACRVGEDPNHRGTSRRWITRAVEDPAPARHRLDRPLPGPPPGPDTDIDETLGVLSDLVHAGKIRAFGASTVPVGDRGSAVGGGAPRPRAVPHRAAAVLDPQPRGRVRRPPHRQPVRDGRADLQPARGWLAHRQLPQGPGRGRAGLARPPPALRGDVRRHLAGQRRQARRRRRARARSPTRSASPRSSWRSRSWCAIRPSRPRSSAHARWSTSSPTSPRTGSSSPPRCSTGSTRSCRRDANTSSVRSGGHPHGVPNLIWTAAADPAQLAGYEPVEFATLGRVTVAPALAVRGVRLRSLDDLAALHGYVLEPMWRSGGQLLVEADRKLTELDPADFVDPLFEHAYTLERALYAARQIWRPAPRARAVARRHRRARRRAAARRPRAHRHVADHRARGEREDDGADPARPRAAAPRRARRSGSSPRRSTATPAPSSRQRLQRPGCAASRRARSTASASGSSAPKGSRAGRGVRQLSLEPVEAAVRARGARTGTWMDAADARAAISDIKLGLLATPAEFAAHVRASRTRRSPASTPATRPQAKRTSTTSTTW